MKTITVSQLGDVITGHTPPTSNREYYGDAYLFLKPTDMIIGSKYTRVTEEGYSDLAVKKYKSSLIPKGSTCVVCIGTLGEKMTMAHCDLFTNQSINSIIPGKDYDPDYVYYLLKYNLHRVKALNKGTASGREFVSKSTFVDLEIDVVDSLEEQKRIGRFLSTFDDLIENNQKQIKLLEEAAQRLYKEWFIDLRFPGHESTPIHDGIPEGWERKTVGELIGKVHRTTQIMTSDYLDDGDIPVIDQSRDFIAGYTNDSDSLVDLGTPVIVFGDHTRILKYITFPFAKGADGTQLIISADVHMPQSLLYCSLINVDLSNYHYARHFKYLKAEEILVPAIDIAKSFEQFTAPVFEQIQCLRDKCLQAAHTRDRLLPKLMSGEIEV